MGCVMEKQKIIDEIEQYMVDISLTLQYEFGSGYENELSSNQQLMMYLIGKKKVTRVKELAHYMNVSASAVSQMAAKMEQLHLLERSVDEENRRSTVLKLQAEGLEMLEHMEERRLTIMEKYLVKLPEEDLDAMRDAFSKLHKLIQDSQKKGDEA
nr:MarR family transcriptional regulator [Alkalicoccus halolimnae]